jgi:hypothetical protein
VAKSGFLQSIARLLTNSAQVSCNIAAQIQDRYRASIRHGLFWDLPTNLGVEFFRLQSNPVFYSRLVAFYNPVPVVYNVSTSPIYIPQITAMGLA